jgi:hypothetical protein
MESVLKKRIDEIKEKYAHWNNTKDRATQTDVITPCGTDCSDIGSDCHGDGECGGDGN